MSALRSMFQGWGKEWSDVTGPAGMCLGWWRPSVRPYRDSKEADSRRHWMPYDVRYLPWPGDRGELGFWLSCILVLMPEMSTHLLRCLTQHQLQSPVKDRGSSIFHATPILTTLRMSSVPAAYLLLWKDNCGCILYSWNNNILSPVLISSGAKGIAYSVQYNIKSSF